MANRAEFTKPTKREALRRSGGLCEGIGPMYGHPLNHRCNFPLSQGVEFDHIILDANSHDNSLENCACCCTTCHRFKTKRDVTTAAKTVRQQDKHAGIKSQKRGFRGWRRFNGEQVWNDTNTKASRDD